MREPVACAQGLLSHAQRCVVHVPNPGKTNMVADALNWKSRGVLDSVASQEWQMLETVGQFRLQYSD